MGCSAHCASTFVVQSEECEHINGKSINGRVSGKVDDQSSEPAMKAIQYHGARASIASGFSFKDTSQDILKFRKERPHPQPTSQELHPEPTSTNQPSGNWKQH